MIHLFSKLAQIFSLLALCIVGLVVALVFVQADLLQMEENEQTTLTGANCGNPSVYPTMNDESLSDTARLGKELFNNNCQQCHSTGADVVVGPGLKDILERRSMEWIVPWVQNSQKMIAAGDPYGTAIYNRYNKAQMQSFDLTADEIKAIIMYVQAYKQVMPSIVQP